MNGVDEQEKGAVTFGEDGLAEVSNTLAKGLVEFYPSQVEVVKMDKEQAEKPKRKRPAQVGG